MNKVVWYLVTFTGVVVRSRTQWMSSAQRRKSLRLAPAWTSWPTISQTRWVSFASATLIGFLTMSKPTLILRQKNMKSCLTQKIHWIGLQVCVCVHVCLKLKATDTVVHFLSTLALHAVPAYRASTYPVSAFPAHSTSFSLRFFSPQWWNVYWVVNQNFHLW